ncbi:MAG: sarcosine oxidase subunit alpha family protein [Alphaproteobacteria bacterium]|nr:sarcosine oxidase subunit alpha family protein [Alphaproteobacteria bacterium]
MSGPHRLPQGGLVDRSRRIGFRFDGRALSGHPGDTLASALLANGVRLVGRSFKYHRPRGVFSAGPEEPNALVGLRTGDRHEPNTRATMVELFDGLAAASQNRWPSLGFDLLAINDLASPLIPAGFYYKTFLWPPSWWPTYERWIRGAAGLGRPTEKPDPDTYEHRHAHCDVLVVGSGPAGLAAARAAASAGARVILVEERAAAGGSLRCEPARIDGQTGLDWARLALDELGGRENAQVLTRTTAFACFDHNVVGLLERVADHLPEPEAHRPRQRLWLVRAHRIVLAAGAIERPLAFGDNDRPGVMLAGAARRYAGEYGVAVGGSIVIVANNDSAWHAGFDLVASGARVSGLVDCRSSLAPDLLARAAVASIPVFPGHVPLRVLGRKAVQGLDIAPADAGDRPRATATLAGDAICVSGGWSPTVHLHSQAGGKLEWREDIAAFVPTNLRPGLVPIGAAAGRFDLSACLGEGHAAGLRAAVESGHAGGRALPPRCDPEAAFGRVQALWAVPQPETGGAKRFVDIQDDVTVEDVALAHRENYVSVEHLKRYTTLGMGTDQGKTSNVAGLALMADLRGLPIPAVGTTTFRPPYTPIALGAVVGEAVGKRFDPIRLTPLHDWHVARGAIMVEAGQWLRPRAYPRPGESFRDAWVRETKQVREKVGLVDVSTLGKIALEGPDAGELIDRLYCNAMRSLPVDKARYGLMLREDGMVMDDGTVAHLAPERYLLTTTTVNAAKVMALIERLLQVDWPELRVAATSVTDQWAQMALSGPDSRAVLARALEGVDVSPTGLPPLGVRRGRIAGVAVTVFRLSYSGELAYEIGAPADSGVAVWEALLAAGAAHDIAPFGTEAMAALRIEKGHVAGPELNGQTTPYDLGLDKLVSRKKQFLGSRLLARPALRSPERPTLVGLVPLDGTTPIRSGSQLIEAAGTRPPVPMLGHVTSVTYSPTLGHPVALALVKGGLERQGGILIAATPLTGGEVPVRVVDPHFHDPEGARQNG